MGNVFNSRRVRATRKPHACEYCLREIPAGSPALYEHGVYEGEAFGRYCCADCEPWLGDFWEFCDGESCDIYQDFMGFARFRAIPHPAFTSPTVCPSCGPVRVDAIDWEDGAAECPRCGVTLEPVEAPC